jgi:Peptidase family M23
MRGATIPNGVTDRSPQGRFGGRTRAWLLMLGTGAWLAPGCGGGSAATAPTVTPSRTACGGYPDQVASPYVLPYPVGQGYWVYQGNCGTLSHLADTEHEYAYDFSMPIGSAVVAVAAGQVVGRRDGAANYRYPGDENYVLVEHGDGRRSYYTHLDTHGVLVDVGQRVEQGEIIGRSGASGTTVRHLHFEVTAPGPWRSLPVTFRNTRPHPNGLQQGELYVAEAY